MLLQEITIDATTNQSFNQRKLIYTVLKCHNQMYNGRGYID